MTDEEFLALAEEARNIRWLCYTSGLNATQRDIEDVLLARRPDIGRDMARDTMAYLFNAGIDDMPGRRHFSEGETIPTLADFPEIAESGIRFPKEK